MADPIWIGEILAGKYRVETILGKGGMGIVLGARHLGLDEPVAIKLLLPAMLEVPGVVERFVREARAATKITSDHVVRVRDIDTLPSGEPYMVMERLEGVDLGALAKERGPLGVDETVGWVLEACEGIAEAHALGIVHRDLKPGNLFLAQRRDGSTSIKVLDFGVSKIAQPEGEHRLTDVGQAVGSPSYMAPEQMMSARDVDGRADIWALGVILYRLITGEPPFKGDSPYQLCQTVLGTAPRRPSELHAGLPAELEAVILRCLEKDPKQRYSTANALASALMPFAGKDRPTWAMEGPATAVLSPGSGAAARSEVARDSMDGTSTPPKPELRRRPFFAGLAVGVLVAVAIAGIAGVVLRSRPSVQGAAPAIDDASAAPSARSAEPVVAPAPPAPSAPASASDAGASSATASSAAPRSPVPRQVKPSPKPAPAPSSLYPMRR